MPVKAPTKILFPGKSILMIIRSMYSHLQLSTSGDPLLNIYTIASVQIIHPYTNPGKVSSSVPRQNATFNREWPIVLCG